MDKLIEELRNWGADTDAGIQRVMNDEEFYRMLVLKFADSPEFETLEAALDRGDRKAAFGIAHSLKGASANLSLTPFYRAVAAVVEDLRKYSGVVREAAEEDTELELHLQQYRMERDLLMSLTRKYVG